MSGSKSAFYTYSCSKTLTVNMRFLGSSPSGAGLPPNEFILPDQGSATPSGERLRETPN